MPIRLVCSVIGTQGCSVNCNGVHQCHVAALICKQKILFTAQGILFLQLDGSQVTFTYKPLAWQPSYSNKGHILTHYQVLLLSKALGFSPAIRFCFPTSPRSQWPQKGICYGLTSPPVQASQLLPLGRLLRMYSGKNLVESSELCFTAVCLCTEPRRLPDPQAEV
ncbi:uncharacterized [Tachysurus ichikawai]